MIFSGNNNSLFDIFGAVLETMELCTNKSLVQTGYEGETVQE